MKAHLLPHSSPRPVSLKPRALREVCLLLTGGSGADGLYDSASAIFLIGLLFNILRADVKTLLCEML